MVEFDLNVEVIEAEADLSFQNKLQEQFIDRFRRILNSGFEDVVICVVIK